MTTVGKTDAVLTNASTGHITQQPITQNKAEKYSELLFQAMDENNDGKISEYEKNNFNIEKLNAIYHEKYDNKSEKNNEKTQNEPIDKKEAFKAGAKKGIKTGLLGGALLGGLIFLTTIALGLPSLGAAGAGLAITGITACLTSILDGITEAMRTNIHNKEIKSKNNSNEEKSTKTYRKNNTRIDNDDMDMLIPALIFFTQSF